MSNWNRIGFGEVGWKLWRRKRLCSSSKLQNQNQKQKQKHRFEALRCNFPAIHFIFMPFSFPFSYPFSFQFQFQLLSITENTRNCLIIHDNLPISSIISIISVISIKMASRRWPTIDFKCPKSKKTDRHDKQPWRCRIEKKISQWIYGQRVPFAVKDCYKFSVSK